MQHLENFWPCYEQGNVLAFFTGKECRSFFAILYLYAINLEKEIQIPLYRNPKERTQKLYVKCTYIFKNHATLCREF